MSVFKGSITEYPGVIVDHFTPFNCSRGRAFFLSHCHKDHMTGLNSSQILDALQRKRTALYCSEVTRSLLLQDPSFTQLAPYLQELPMDEPVSMNLEACVDTPPLNFTVTLLPAGHCPGSSMFFYQGSNGGVLYTGDFRLTLEETKRLKSLHCGSSLLEIKSLYLDTTFCHPMATTIPSRDVSREHIIKIAEKWLSRDSANVLHLQLGMFGYEHIYMGMAKRFNSKVHIARWRMNAYRDLPAVADCLTVDGESTRIHACSFRKGVRRCPGVPCGSRYSNGRPPSVLSIKPSTLWFLSNSGSLTEPYKYLPECNVYRVLHSMHASYSELCDFIAYLKPSRIVPCVIPLGDRSLADVNVRLKGLLPHVEVVAESAATESNATAVTPRTREERGEDINECSNDTIDEFASSEESHCSTHNETSFDSSTGMKPFMLPAMFMDNVSECSEGDVGRQGRIPESLCSSNSATLGSLEQTPIDLSPETTPTDPDVSITHVTSREITGEPSALEEEENELRSAAYCVRCESPTLWNALIPDRKTVSKNGQSAHTDSTDRGQSSLLTSLPVSATGRGCSSSPSNHSWHLTLESSTEDDRVTDSSDTDQTLTPEPKRVKLDYHDHQTTNEDHHTSEKTVHHEREKRSLSVEIIEHRVIDYIDLTQDPPSPCDGSCGLRTAGEGGVGRNSLSCELEDSPSDSQQSNSLSPPYLPPTPGREKVDSILERKSIAFNTVL